MGALQDLGAARDSAIHTRLLHSRRLGFPPRTCFRSSRNPRQTDSRAFDARSAYGKVSGPPGLHTKVMDRRPSLAPTPAASQPGQPDESRACRECQRRRVKCDGSMPECAVCQRYRRHCLYDKHSRTRLTRKYAVPQFCLSGVVSCG